MVRFDTLEALEKRFQSEAKGQLTPTTVKFPNNENLSLDIQVFKPNRTGYFYEVAHPKKRIVIHFTAGNLRSDMISLTGQDRHVSVPFVIARDGTIYNLFSSKYWSGHIGAGIGNAKGTGNPQDKATIGIELSNYGYLTPKEGKLETIYSRVKDEKTGKISPVDIFCDLDQTDAYIKLNKAYRNQAHYASYTPEQIDSLIILLRFLTAKYNIKREFLSRDEHFERIEDILNFDGIVTHADYRAGGKWDIGPAFDWNTLITGVQAAQYTPKFGGDRSAVMVIDSEDELLDNTRSLNQIQEEETTDNEGYNPNDFEDKSVNDSNMKTPILHALLIGINNYDKIRKLSGCINDVNTIEKYINLNFEGAQIKKLIDGEASRQGIIEGIRSHFKNAQKDDTFLIYFSGHGTQEKADTTIWKEETDGSLECIVCHDKGAKKPADYLLADKELRFLLKELSGISPNIVDVFDCCNSGDNTRNGGLMMGSSVNEKSIRDKNGDSFPQRAWSDFLFANQISEVKAKAADSVSDILPEGPHIQLAACESDQSAIEMAGEGVFTKTLLKILKDCGSNISYTQLNSRLRAYMRGVYEQTPRIYAPDEKSLSAGFLNRTVDPQRITCEVILNNENGWQLNMGAIHGINQNSKILISMPNSNKIIEVKPKSILVDYTILEDGPDIVEGGPKMYKAEVEGIMTKILNLELKNHDASPEEVMKISNALIQSAKGAFAFTDTDINYTLHLKSGEVFLTQPNDSYRPLICPINYYKEKAVEDISAQFQHVSRWYFIKNLQNPTSNMPASPLEIELKRISSAGEVTTIDISNGTANLEYEKIGTDWKGTIQLKITNTTTQDLYFCVAYLSKEFECFLKFLPTRVHKLQAGSSIFLGPNGKDRINLKLGEVVKQYNWPQSEEYLKFIISTDLFDAEALTLDELERPYVLADKGQKKVKIAGVNRGDLDTEEEKPVVLTGWNTQSLTLKFKNPVYNQIPAKTLQNLIEWEETSYFATNLYCKIKLDEKGQPTIWEINEELIIPEDEKGLFDNIKMWLGNQIETLQRRKRYNNLKQDPSRLRIVAEGDSWFQYPIILEDTLDHLYKRYAICSFAEAGDTLENYLKKREYVEAIRTEGAKFFLVSGGGNDVVGEEMKGFLRDKPDANDNTPKRYLNDAFEKQLKRLEELYIKMFDELLTLKQSPHIIVHCYDYIIPIDTRLPGNQGKSSWSGKHMIAAGIEPQSEREKLTEYMIDQFASMLEKLSNTKKYKNKVSFINTRKTVNRNSWHDEIHPTSEAYALVANKFIKEIERIKAQKKST